MDEEKKTLCDTCIHCTDGYCEIAGWYTELPTDTDCEFYEEW